MTLDDEKIAGGMLRAGRVVHCDDRLPVGVDAVALLGEKAASLLRMYQAGLPVPPFFVITPGQAEGADEAGQVRLTPDLQIEVRHKLQALEQATGRCYGEESAPLLLAVRCSANGFPAGALPHVLNLGMTPRIAQALVARTADDRFVFDAYRRLIAQYARMVHGVDVMHFQRVIRSQLDNRGLQGQEELDGFSWRELTRQFHDVYSMRVGGDFAKDPTSQLWQALEAALGAGDRPEVAAQRRRAAGAGSTRVSVIVQAMVFGNRDTESLAGVACTRDPQSGALAMIGEYVARGQGSDLLEGELTPASLDALQAETPGIHDRLRAIGHELEKCFGDAREFEFTVEKGQPYVLGSWAAGRSVRASVEIAVDLCRSGVISREAALSRIDPASLEQMLHARFDLSAAPQALTRGLSASPGAAVGALCFSAADAMRRAARGERVILVRRETDATDVIGMQQCAGILTSTGGMTSHASVVARGMGKPCVVGAGELQVDERRSRVSVGRFKLGPEDVLSIDGRTGEVFAGEVPRISGQLTPALEALLGWADAIRTLGIYANAETPADVEAALRLGAEGIGLCRTEHMFFAPRRILLMRKMILAAREDLTTRQGALDELLPYQREDFAAIFALMAGRPVIIRLLDPPLHEFLPHGVEDRKELAHELELTQREVRRRIEQMRESNPMLGHRGCRLAISFPEILAMQVRAIVEAAAQCLKMGTEVTPWIMVPFTMGARELEVLRGHVRTAAEAAMRDVGVLVSYKIGTMIETPRAALLAGELARQSDFISFGTNDLTQATLAISRDDAGTFLGEYEAKGILEVDPFRQIDRAGVGELMRMAVGRGRAVRADLSCGVCGEHAGDPASIAFFAELGASYVSCSPMRLPIARLAAAQVACCKEVRMSPS